MPKFPVDAPESFDNQIFHIANDLHAVGDLAGGFFDGLRARLVA